MAIPIGMTRSIGRANATGSVSKITMIAAILLKTVGAKSMKRSFSRLRICLTGQKKEPAKAVKNVPGAGKRILYIPIRWDMKFYLPSIITGVN